MLAKAEEVKNELKQFELIHENRRGLNVIAKFNTDVIKYCTEKNYHYTLCPNYVRVNEKAVCIELKRLNI